MKRYQKTLCLFLTALMLFPLFSAAACAMGTVTVTLNGNTVVTDGTLNLSREGSQLVYVEVEHADHKTECLYTETVEVKEGDIITPHYLTLYPAGDPQARVCSPTGLRFVTAMTNSEYEAIKSDGNVKRIELGTLITTTELAEQAGSVTHQALQDLPYLDVVGSRYNLYDRNLLTDTVYLAGSVVNIKTANYNRTFTGVGYVKVTMDDGTVRMLYATDDVNAAPSGTLAVAAIYQSKAPGLTDTQKKVLRTFKNAYNGEMNMLYNKDLTGLNVLAIGDSLFYGSGETVGDKIWVNTLGKQYGWNLTNLGRGGATVSFDPNRTATNVSMYDLLMHDKAYVWGTSDTRFYQSGNPSGKAEDVDLILLEGGSNDYGTKVQAPQGTTDSKDPATFLGAWNLMTQELLERYPNATVVFITAWENVDQPREDQAVAAKYTSSVVDLYRDLYYSNPRVELINAGSSAVSGIQMIRSDGTKNSEFIAEYAYDSYHLNDKGMELMAGNMLPLLWDVIARDRGVARTQAEQMQWDLRGLNVLALGDSLFSGVDNNTPGCTRANQWVNLMGKNSNWNLTNLGIGGMTVSLTDKNYTTKGKKASMYDWLFNGYNDYHWNTEYNRIFRAGKPDSQTNESGAGGSYNKYFQIGSFYGKSNEDVDLILLEGGCNDYGTEIAAPLGIIGSTAGDTFIGAYNAITQKLLETYPNAKIVFITTWRLGNQTRPNDTLTSIEYSESVIGLYEKCYADNDRVYLINAGDPAVSGVDIRDSGWRSFYSNDSYHLNDKGMKIMADHMLPYIWDIMKNGK